jgi:cyclohexyl-isocyanide hydratase
METDRRTLIAGVTGAALLAPYFALERAMAAQTGQTGGGNPTPAEQKAMADQHMEAMTRVLGPGLWGQEQVGMLLYPGFTALDLVGPHYFFACMFGATVHLITTEADLTPVKSDLGLSIAPTTTMANAPKTLDIIFTPGGTEGTLGVMRRADCIDWLKDRATRAKYITSVCTGSMILAKAGLLKGKRATSHWVTRDALADFGATPVNQRVVRDGNVLTGAGVSSGLDFAIALVEIVRGKPYAEGLMLQAEYHPEPPFAGGTLATTSPDVAKMMDDMFKPVVAQFKALAKS